MMRQSRRSRWVGGLAIAVLMMGAGEGARSEADPYRIAQVTPDNTLGTQVNGTLTPCAGFCVITNGTTRGSNLFHSFRQFSLPNGDFAGFVTTPTIQNVIVRVTGVGQPFISNINGTIATINAAGNAINPANFFLLNPNGIVFGPKAQILVGGSFLASTAERMLFRDGTVFDTRDQTVSPLLTISVPTGLQIGQTPGAIQMQPGSQLDSTTKGNSRFSNLSLVGGDILLNGAQIFASRGQLELAGIGAAGVVGLDLTNDSQRLNVPDNLTRANVTLTNGSILGIFSTQGGDITINARNLSLSNGSVIATFFLSGNQSGDIVLNTTETIALSQESQVGNTDYNQVIGNGGNIRIQAGALSVTGGYGFQINHFGSGNSGNIMIDARDSVAFDGEANDNIPDKNIDTPSTAIVSNFSGRGNSGEIRINTGSFSLTNGASLLNNNFQPGTAGNITINARDAIFMSGETKDGFFSQITSSSSQIPNNSSNAGNIQINTGSLTLTNGAKVDASSFGQGKAGRITINARDAVTFDGRSSYRLSGVSGASGVSSARFAGSGSGGDIQISANSLSITNGANLDTSTSAGRGNAGNISINTRDRVTVDGTSTDGFSSRVSSAVGSDAVGNGGDIQVVTNVLAITNGANLNTSTRGQGNGGKIVINARDQTIVDGQGSNGAFSSIQSSVDTDQANGLSSEAVRKAGDLVITTGSLLLNEGFLSTGTLSDLGEAGNIKVIANRLVMDNNAIIEATAVSGNGGNITLFVRDLALLRRNSIISARSGTVGTGQGNGGNILINTPFLISAPLENSDIKATAFRGKGGTVTINAIGIYWFIPRSRADLERLLGTTDPAKLDPNLLPTNDITAISQGSPNLSGTVTLNVLNVDPSRGLVQLPGGLADASRQITERCSRSSRRLESSFYITGNGGFPEKPGDPPIPYFPTGDVQTIALNQPTPTTQTPPPTSPSPPPSPSSPPAIVEAQGWIQDANGNVFLVAHSPSATLHLPLPRPAFCP